jgi:hypothetical protein
MNETVLNGYSVPVSSRKGTGVFTRIATFWCENHSHTYHWLIRAVVAITAFAIRPECPRCGMNMVVTNGFDLDRERQTFECSRCGRVDEPSNPIKRAA